MTKPAVFCAALLIFALTAVAALARPDNPLRPAPADTPTPVTKPSSPVKPGQTLESAYRTSQDGKTRLFLVRTDYKTYSLFVAGGQGLQVTYHTTINSSRPVVAKLKPVQGGDGCLSEYRFTHTFSRTTIWMALEFARDGKPLPELKRDFMNGIKPGLR